jgi:nitrate reductase NapE
MDQEQLSTEELSQREWRTFLFIIIAMFPILSVAVVGGYGFIIWMSQILLGPPGHG